MALVPRDYQQRVIGKVIEGVESQNLSTFMVQSPTGCLTGDTEILVNRGGGARRFTLRTAYQRSRGGEVEVLPGTCLCGCGEAIHQKRKSRVSRYLRGHTGRSGHWNLTIPTNIRSLVGDRIGLHRAEQFVCSGLKFVYKLALADGKDLIGTYEHLIMTRDGWVPLGDLKSGMEVMVDTPRPVPGGRQRPKLRDSYITNLYNHPYGLRVATAKGDREHKGYTIRVPLHRAIYEAHHNGLTLNEYVQILRHGDSGGLELVDPKVTEIHHVDGDHYNNDPSNLEALTPEAHASRHNLTANFGQGIPSFCRVETVSPFGEEMTYDVRCAAPHHNFVANGIVVHNSGKTCIGIELARYFHRTRGWKTNWVAMRRKLLTQVREMQAFHYPEDAGLDYMSPVSMFDRDPPEADITVVDESHHDACTSSTVNHARVQPKLVIGLSATPMRTDKLRLAFQRTIIDAGIHRLIGEGWLSQFNHWNIPKYDPSTVAQFYLREREKWGKTAVFFLSIHDCYRFKQLLLLEGVRCNVVSSRQPEAEREDRIHEFEGGPVDVIANVQILAEGYDYAGLQTVFVRDSSRLPAIQIGGRVLRPHDSKAEGANIVQSIETHWPFTRTAHSKTTNLWRDDKWLTLHGKNEKIEEAHEAYAQAIPQSVFEPLPKLLADMQAKRRARIWRRSQTQWTRRPF